MVRKRPWANSTRAQRLPNDWPQRRAAVKKRAGNKCEASPHDPRCTGNGTECDHIVAGDNHQLDNLQWLSHPCHRAKTLREAKEASTAKRNQLRLDVEAHPGRTWG